MQPFKSAKSFARMTPRDLVKIHIFNPNHIVTEEEFSLLRIGEEAFNENSAVQANTTPQTQFQRDTFAGED